MIFESGLCKRGEVEVEKCFDPKREVPLFLSDFDHSCAGCNACGCSSKCDV
jgi:hypothetical protein